MLLLVVEVAIESMDVFVVAVVSSAGGGNSKDIVERNNVNSVCEFLLWNLLFRVLPLPGGDALV